MSLLNKNAYGDYPRKNKFSNEHHFLTFKDNREIWLATLTFEIAGQKAKTGRPNTVDRPVFSANYSIQ